MKNIPKQSDTDLFSPAKPLSRLDEKYLTDFGFPRKFLHLINKLYTPEKIQEYLKEELLYNEKETYRSFIDIVELKIADCFEGGVGFAYPLLYLHGYSPKIVMIHADNRIDVDHTLVAYKLKNKIGAIAKSNYPLLMDRPPEFGSLRDLILTYYPHYVCEIKEHEFHGMYTVIGFSDPIDLVEKFGTKWFFARGNNTLKNLYNHFTDGVWCTRIFSDQKFLYPPEEKV
ncbi:hypothetical protein HY041_01525 [Candidatus Roizmanbacteria bacterium]|nr:hypothetical protein [Candidatus Roizmanbacteria bacterium]